jgi:hypothetical protein
VATDGRNNPAEGYGKSAAVVKEELKRLEAELQRADHQGDRRLALNILSRMLDLQRRFMDRWQGIARPTPAPLVQPQGRAQVVDDDDPSGVTPPGRSGSNPGNV